MGKRRGRVLNTVGSNFLRMGLSWVTFIFTGAFLSLRNYLQGTRTHRIRKRQQKHSFLNT